MEEPIRITDQQQQQIIDKAVELLSPHIKEQVSTYTVYYKTKSKGDFGGEGDSCDGDECIKLAKAAIRKHAGKGKWVEAVWYDNGGDHETIKRCCICFKPLNSWLTWIQPEFEHHEEYTTTKEEMISSAFDVHAMLQSFPSRDHVVKKRVGNYNLYNKQLADQKAFVVRVLNYASLVISTLKPKKIEITEYHFISDLMAVGITHNDNYHVSTKIQPTEKGYQVELNSTTANGVLKNSLNDEVKKENITVHAHYHGDLPNAVVYYDIEKLNT